MTFELQAEAEAQRLETLRRYAVLDSAPEQALDDLAALAALVCEAPMACVSIIDERRLWFKSKFGFTVDEMPRELAFCNQAIGQVDLMTVPDTTRDERFSNHPLVTGDLQIRFYAGMPLITPAGHTLGMLCVMDRVPRQLRQPQEEALRRLGRQVMSQLELRRQTRELAEADERLRLVTETASVGLVIVNQDRRYVYANAAYARMLELPSGDLIGRRVADVLAAIYAEQIGPRLDQALAGQRVSYELRKPGPLGDHLYLVRYEPTEVAGLGRLVVVVITDITERKQAEMAALRLAAIVESSVDAIIGKDLNSLITTWNRSAERIFGYAASEMVGTSIMRLIPADRQDEEVHILERIRCGESVEHFETKRLTKEGKLLEVAITVSPIKDATGRVIGVSKIARDITERKRLERQFLRAQRMESIGTLAGGIAHDLNNVLTPILMSLVMLQEYATDEQGQDVLEILQSSAKRGSEMVKQLMTFARGVEGERASINLEVVMRDLLRVARETFPKSIEVNYTPPHELWTVMGDATQLHQVLVNLCVNARDAMPSGGSLSLALENVVLDETYAAMNLDARAGAYVRVKVADTGCGIPPEVRDRIFEPFFTTKDVGKGTGLGLSTSLAIVKGHGGFINVYSEPGQGTRFHVYVPANTGAAAAQEVAIEQTRLPRGSGELILVVDDEEAIRNILRSTLQRFGYRVLLAVNGAEAVALYVTHRPDVAAVITDMAMPVMDGPATIIALKAINPAVKIVGTSGLAANAGVARALGAGVNHFVPKPFTADAVLRTLNLILQGE